MSRIGKMPIGIPEGVSVEIQELHIKVKGPKGELNYNLIPGITIIKSNDQLILDRSENHSRARAFHGLCRSLIANMIEGVSSGFEKRLKIIGTGYRAQLSGSKLVLNLGFSHQVELEPLEGITFEVPDQNTIRVVGISKQVVGQQAASIRKIRPPEPYGGKGVRYEGEYVRRKAGKAKASAGE
jgi:large subunit ribosomal protein L6|tara:strand:- start:122 stop:670 length:549 start_codon:yes stop_codon:yes gene_type:complete